MMVSTASSHFRSRSKTSSLSEMPPVRDSIYVEKATREEFSSEFLTLCINFVKVKT